MEKLIKWAAVLFVAALAIGCNKVTPSEEPVTIPEETVPSTPPKAVTTLTVSAVAKNPQTKISYGTTDATWEEGDKIFLIKSDGTTITLTLTEGAGTSTGKFISSDPVVEGSYIPYAVSATSLTKGFVNVTDGTLTLNLETPGGATLADILEHDILKGDALTLTADQTTASITGLTTHFLSYIRFRFNCSAKEIESVGMDTAGGVYKTVTIAPNGTVSGSNASTEVFYTEASSDGQGTYAGYFAVYDKTTTSLMAHAVDEDGKGYTRLVSTKDADYEAGKVYGKTMTLYEDMATSAMEGTYANQTWENLGLSVKWARFNVGSTSEYSYDRNFGNCINRGECNIPIEWDGWRKPTDAEAYELFYASTRTWVSETSNGVRFDCNGNYVPMGAGGRARQNDASADYEYGIGSDVYFYVSSTGDGGYGNTVQVWAIIGSGGNSIGFGSSNVETRNNYWYNQCAMRLVCDYKVLDTEATADSFQVGDDSYDENDFE
jgi:hypothetical protein